MRRGPLAPSAGVRARVASRLALPRRHASSCPCAAVLSRQPIGRYDRVESVGSLRARCACSLPVLWRRAGMGGATRVTARGRSFRGQFASCCSDALRQSPGSAAGSPCCVWRRPCSRQAMAYSAPLPAGTVVAARSLSGAGGRCDATSRSTAAAARLQRGRVGPRGDGAVARARRSSRRVGTAVHDDPARGRRGGGGSAAAWPWTGAGGGKGGPGVQARRRPPRRGRRAEARKRPCLIFARRLFSVRSLVYTTSLRNRNVVTCDERIVTENAIFSTPSVP